MESRFSSPYLPKTKTLDTEYDSCYKQGELIFVWASGKWLPWKVDMGKLQAVGALPEQGTADSSMLGLKSAAHLGFV